MKFSDLDETTRKQFVNEQLNRIINSTRGVLN